MTFIQAVAPDQADAALRSLYDKVAGPTGEVDQILQVHGLRPHTLEGHMALYKAVLHHHGNELPKWLLETIGVQVSLLNQCQYCVVHHWHGLGRLTSNADNIVAWLRADDLSAAGPLSDSQTRLLAYSRTLTLSPAAIGLADVDGLRQAGWTDGQILECNQVAAYFSYVNRVVLGLGVKPVEAALGLSPSGEGWSHE